MRIADFGGSHFTIRQIGMDSGRNIHAKVNAAGYGFAAANKSVWFDRHKIDAFVRDLRKLVEELEGSAALDSMSPDECKILIKNSDQLGHLYLDVRISRYLYFFGTADPIYCRIRVEIDPTSFPSIVAELAGELGRK
jgi:hypothetical protein